VLLASARAFRVGGLAAWRWGGGPPILLAHGWEGRGSQLGAFVEPLVSRGFSVVTFDAPAHGASPGTQATLRDFANAIRAVGARVGTPVGVIGHSFGALATLMAVKDGLSPSSLVLIAPPSPKEHLAWFESALEIPSPVMSELKRRFEHRVGRSFDEVEGPALAEGLGLPGLVLHDRTDKEVAWQRSAEIVRAWPAATLQLTERLGHRRILKDAAVVSRVTDFVVDHAP
jgi:pimeloyl-ACP methyl ester carboxylesterase